MPEDTNKNPEEDKTRITQRPPPVKLPTQPGALPQPLRPFPPPGVAPTPVKVPTVLPSASTVASKPGPTPPPTVKLQPATVALPSVPPPPMAKEEPPKTEGIPSAAEGGQPGIGGRKPTRRLRPATGGIIPAGPGVTLPATAGIARAAAPTENALPIIQLILSIAAVALLAYACLS